MAASNGEVPTRDAPSAGPLGQIGKFIKLDKSRAQQKIRVRKLVSLNKRVGLAAGFDVTCATGEVKPCGQIVVKVPVLKTDTMEAFNVNVSDKRVSLTGKFAIPLGALSLKGHGRVGVNYAGRKPYFGIDVVPTRAPTVALGATTALYAGKKLSSSPHISLTKNVGLDFGINAVKEKDGPLTVALEDCSLSVKL